ncbi:MAG TPA: ABC transporter substrate-binding protein [Gaiellaceae bacterium]|jgi:peptide/nickel transport system substrate-binding protein
MKRVRSVAIATVVAAGLALVVSACGGSSSSSGGSATTTTSSTTGTLSTATYPTLNVVWGTTDYMDPGLSYRLESWQIFQDTYLGLVYKAHVSCLTGNCAKIEPGLATNIGTVTNGAKTYKFTLRKGLKYSDGTPIKASDFKNTIIRDFNLNSPGVSFYSNIVGIDACENNPTKCKSISGIVTNDAAGTITINLKTPESDFEYVLSIPFSSLVPSSTPHQDTENPPPPANGPYYIASYNPSKSFVLKRNPHWKKNEIPGIPNGNADQINGTMTDDQARAAQLTASGQDEYDEDILPTDQLSHYKTKYPNQIKFWTTPSTYYFFMNQRTPPFNNLKVRQAVNYAVNRAQLVNLRGGLGVPTYNFLPPSYPQYKKLNPSPYPYNLTKAKQLIQESGMAGTPVKVYTISDVAVDLSTGEYLQGQLNKIGLKATLKPLAGANYFTIMGNQSTKAQIGFTDWFEDFPYPTDWFNTLLNGNAIHPVHNNNYGNVSIPAQNKAMAKLAALPPSQALSSSTNASWAKIDEAMSQDAATVPYLNGIITSFFSTKLNPACDVFDDNQDDIAQFCQK